MPDLIPGVILPVAVADTGWVAHVFAEADGSVRVLTGYAAWVTYIEDGAAAPHVVRAAIVDGANGTVRYKQQGDEYPTYGKLVWRWFTVQDSNWHKVTSSPVGRRVDRRPT